MIDSTKRSKLRPYIVGIAGGSGSGKTYFARALQKALGLQHCSLIYQDNFYFDQSKKFDHDGGSVNFDHPSAIDFDLLFTKLQELRSGNLAQIPIYDFVTHSRSEKTLAAEPTQIVLVDGILIFSHEKVRSVFDDMIFFDTPEELRFGRRLKRDVEERGRTEAGVLAQFTKQVKPMHDEYVQPSMQYAHTIIRDLGEYSIHLESYVEKLKALVL